MSASSPISAPATWKNRVVEGFQARLSLAAWVASYDSAHPVVVEASAGTIGLPLRAPAIVIDLQRGTAAVRVRDTLRQATLPAAKRNGIALAIATEASVPSA